MSVAFPATLLTMMAMIMPLAHLDQALIAAVLISFAAFPVTAAPGSANQMSLASVTKQRPNEDLASFTAGFTREGILCELRPQGMDCKVNLGNG
jgi:hypothetical protein